MKLTPTALVIALASGLLGLSAGSSLSASQAQETNYLVMQEFKIASDQAPGDAIERLSGWVRALRATGKHSDVRLFFHDWGPEVGLYIVSETSDWNAIGTIFSDVLAVEPDFLERPLGFAGHSDNILTEIPVP